jgi:hypothetical protein
MNSNSGSQAVLCVANEGNEVSLQLWKIYKTLRDDEGRAEGFVRVIDESGEDYLFPEENFVPIDLPREARRPFDRAVREQQRSAVTPRTPDSARRARGGASIRSSKRRGA